MVSPKRSAVRNAKRYKWVALRVKLIENLRRELGRRRGDVENSPGGKAILRIARDHMVSAGGYVVETSAMEYLKPPGRPTSRQRCLVIDPTRLPPALGLDEESFPRDNDGGVPTNQKELLDTWRGRSDAHVTPPSPLRPQA